MKPPKASWLFLLALILAWPAWAVEFNRLLPERSRIAFVTTQMGVAVVGSCRAFRADLAFDPARPAAARVRMEVDMASVDAGSKEGNAEAKGADWLHVAAYPEASFESTSVRALGGDRYEVRGRLTLRGHSRAVKARFTFRRQGTLGLFEGQFRIKRLDYGIGQAVWGDTGVVSDVVRIRFVLVADSGMPAIGRRDRRSE